MDNESNLRVIALVESVRLYISVDDDVYDDDDIVSTAQKFYAFLTNTDQSEKK